ncbi:MAG: hypothetical protein ABIH22_02060 [Candidatus Margulisiibacteriota bacterium]
MRKLFGLLLVLGMAVILTGCIEGKQIYYLNPDGSGKVAVDVLFQAIEIEMTGMEKQDTTEILTDAVRKTLNGSQGVDAWKDVAYKLTDDGRISFKGTAYFPDVSKLRLSFGGIKMQMRDFVFKKDAAGNTVFELVTPQEDGKAKKTAPAKLTEKEIQEMIKMERVKYNQSKPMLATVFTPLNIDLTFYLPGKVGEAVNLNKTDDGAVRLVFDGRKMLEVIDEMYADEALLRKSILAGVELLEDTSESQNLYLNEKLFGKKDAIYATLAGEMKPLFDYKKEVAGAQKENSELIEKFGAKAAATPAAPAKGGDFKSLKVKSVNMGQDWYTLILEGELPGAVLNIVGGRLEKAIADNGEDLLPGGEWDREISFPSLFDNNTVVEFDVKMNLPGEKVKGLKEISGTLQYLVGDKAPQSDLGIIDFKVAAKGNKFGAVIESLEGSDYVEGQQTMGLRLDISPPQLKSATFYDKNGQVLDVRNTGYFSSGDVATFSFSCDQGFPAKGRIVVEVYEDLQKYEIPFKITDITLLGKPR